jgi:hypothetical protein
MLINRYKQINLNIHGIVLVMIHFYIKQHVNHVEKKFGVKQQMMYIVMSV